jgi:hypothetical protein
VARSIGPDPTSRNSRNALSKFVHIVREFLLEVRTIGPRAIANVILSEAKSF